LVRPGFLRLEETEQQMMRRCAVYTRKSSEEGLEQEFNSLHAQREACEAFIKSQKGEGWKLVPTAYDDGGLSSRHRAGGSSGLRYFAVTSSRWDDQGFDEYPTRRPGRSSPKDSPLSSTPDHTFLPSR
jgi:hypothetical protein